MSGRQERLEKLRGKIDEQTPRFETLDEQRYRFEIPGVATFEADHVRRESHQLKCELMVTCPLPGARTFGGVLSTTDLNLSAARTRSMHAKYLADRARAEDLDWTGYIEEFAQRVLAAERAGEPAVLLSTLNKPVGDGVVEFMGIPLLQSHPTILFGDGGTAKSYLALYLAGELARQGWGVGYFDWELAGEDHRGRLELLFGPRMPEIHYVRCSRSFYHEADRLRHVVRAHGLDYVVIDSVAFACDGPPESAEAAGKYFQALRRLGVVGSLHVAHVTKDAENGDKKPFGTVFWHNGARSTWNVKLADPIPGGNIVSVALHHRKANLGARRPSVGLRFIFLESETRVQRFNLADEPELAAEMPLKSRMAAALKSGPQGVNDLAEDLDAKANSLRKAVRDNPQRFVLLDGGKKVSLLARQDDER